MSKYIEPNESGLFDIAMRLEELQKMGDPLARLDEVIDWSLFEQIGRASCRERVLASV